MTNSLKEKLLGLGFKAPEPEPRPERRPERRPDGRPEGRTEAGRGPRPDRRGERNGRPDAGSRGGGRREGGTADAGRGKTGASAGPGRDKSGAPADAGRGRRGGAPAAGAGRGNRPAASADPRRGGAARPREDIDLAKAYAIRAQREKDERIEAERVRQEEARVRREAKAKLAEFVRGKALNDAAADIARHFPYGGKIKRVHVTAEQLRQLNAGQLGVLQLDGRYLLVDATVLAGAEAIFAPAVALRVDPSASASDDPYADPRYQVPDDLVW